MFRRLIEILACRFKLFSLFPLGRDFMRAGETKGSRQVYGYIDEGQVPSAAELKRTGTNPSGAECPFGEKQVLFSSSSPLTATSIYTAFALTLQDESSSSRSSSIRRGGRRTRGFPLFYSRPGTRSRGYNSGHSLSRFVRNSNWIRRIDRSLLREKKRRFFHHFRIQEGRKCVNERMLNILWIAMGNWSFA